jgi:hypothetical protein
MRRLLALWHCMWAPEDYSIYSGMEAQRAYAAHGLHTTLFNCEVCGKYHLRGRS